MFVIILSMPYRRITQHLEMTTKVYLSMALLTTGLYLNYLADISYVYGASTSNVLQASTEINTFSGQYYNGMTLSDLKVSGVTTSAINYDWGMNAPYKALDRDAFSARWLGLFDFATNDTYKFSATYDGGLRLYVDGELVINDWKSGPKRTSTKDLFLTAGQHNLQVEYFESTGKASVTVSWEKIGLPLPITPTYKL